MYSHSSLGELAELFDDTLVVPFVRSSADAAALLKVGLCIKCLAKCQVRATRTTDYSS